MKKTLLLALTLVCALGCRPAVDRYVEFLYESMPLGDSLMFSRDYWSANVSKTLEVRSQMGWDIPEREFKHFVLPLRVNNENLDSFRLVYADSLCARVQGMSMSDAALEVNHWCHEMATYVPSDGRTLGPIALIRSGLGRCGEESVLAVSALRAAGLPARQVYTPRWAHTDDNHAWVEVYVDGAWHFMGACEPEPVLDKAWFNSSVSRAMLLHTKVFGNYDGPEDVISRTHAYTEINCIRSYIPTRRTHVVVHDKDGQIVPGATVRFCIYNYAEFYPVATYLSDAQGVAALDTGVGDMVVWASAGDKFGLAVVPGSGAGRAADGGLGSAACGGLGSAENPAVVVLDKTFGQPYSIDLDIVPPAENPLPDSATPEQIALNNVRLASEDSIRLGRPHPKTYAPELFLAAKDAIDVTQEVIEDARACGLTGNPYIDSPRVELEMLVPFRREFLSSEAAKEMNNPSAVAAWVGENIQIANDRNPQGLRIPPVAVLRGKIADSRSRDIFFVAACRALGCPARLDEATSVPQYFADNQWVAVDFNSGSQTVPDMATLAVDYTRAPGCPVRSPKYYYNYTVSRIVDGIPQLCEYDEDGPTRSEYELEKGYYMLTSGTRLADGSVLAHVELFNLASKTHVPLILRSSSEKVQVIGSIDAEKKFLLDGTESSILAATGRGYFMLAITGIHDEPTSHAIGQLEELAQEINDWGRPVIVLDGRAPEGLQNLITGKDINSQIRQMISEGVETDAKKTLPIIIVADSFGRVVYLSSGYNTSLASQLRSVFNQL